MTDLETYLKEVKERCDAATKGPWDSEEMKIEYSWFQYDSDFIAHARTDVPKLIKMLLLAKQDLSSITNISKDKCKNLAQACLDDMEKLARGDM